MNCDVLKSKSPCFLLNKNIYFNKTKHNRKWKIQHTVLKRRTSCFAKEKKRVLLLTFILSEGNFFNMCVLSKCILYWINFENIYTFTFFLIGKKLIKKHYFIYFCLLVKSSKGFSAAFIYQQLSLKFFLRSVQLNFFEPM